MVQCTTHRYLTRNMSEPQIAAVELGRGKRQRYTIEPFVGRETRYRDAEARTADELCIVSYDSVDPSGCICFQGCRGGLAGRGDSVNSAQHAESCGENSKRLCLHGNDGELEE